jgi:hypothetical protein
MLTAGSLWIEMFEAAGGDLAGQLPTGYSIRNLLPEPPSCFAKVVGPLRGCPVVRRHLPLPSQIVFVRESLRASFCRKAASVKQRKLGA